jgi:small subunit ribosomal protein S2
MNQRPGAVFIVDIITEANALREARKLNIPTVALVDTNADPSLVTYPVPCNDDAVKAIQLMADYVEQAIAQGKAKNINATDNLEKAKEVITKSTN